MQRQPLDMAKEDHSSVTDNPVRGYQQPYSLPLADASQRQVSKERLQQTQSESMLPPLDNAAILSSAAAQIPTAFVTSSIFDQPYTTLEPAYVKQPDFRIKTTTPDNQPKTKSQETANYDQLKRYLDSTQQQQQPSVISYRSNTKIFESLNPFRQIQTHYALKEQKEQQEQEKRELQKDKGKGRGKNHRQRMIEERTQGYEHLHRLIETKRVSITPTAHTTKYEPSSCRAGELSAFIQSQQVLDLQADKKDLETTRKMKEQLEQIGQLEQHIPTSHTAAKQQIGLPKLSNCDENTCPHCFEDFLGKEDVIRTTCRHTFHTTCYEQLRKEQTNNCPACDGDLNPTHRWTYIPLKTTSQQDTNQIVSGPATRPATRNTTEFLDDDTKEQLPAPEQQLPEQQADSDSDYFDRLLKTPPATPPRPTAANNQQHVYSSVDTHVPLSRGTDYNRVPPIPPIREVRISTFNELYKPQTFSRPGSAPTTRQCFPIYSQPESGIGLSVSGIKPAEPIHRSDSYITTTELHDGQQPCWRRVGTTCSATCRQCRKDRY